MFAGFGNRPRNSRVITQEFQANGSSLILRDGKPDLGALDVMFAPTQPDALSQTPKALLDSVPHVPRVQVNVTSKIGEGAFGEVSKAEVFPYGTVAIKWLKKDRLSKYSESFQREAEVLSRLNHPNIIRMFGLVSESQESALAGNNGPAASGSAQQPAVPAAQQQLAVGKPGNIIVSGIIMEYVRGGSLAQVCCLVCSSVTCGWDKQSRQLSWNRYPCHARATLKGYLSRFQICPCMPFNCTDFLEPTTVPTDAPVLFSAPAAYAYSRLIHPPLLIAGEVPDSPASCSRDVLPA
jgi:hypothetical protein